jgi:antitoxin Phd
MYFSYDGRMKYVSDTEAKQDFGGILATAQHEPVVIGNQKRDMAVVLSMEEYHQLTKAYREDFNKFCSEASQKAKEAGLTETILGDILGENMQAARH